MRTIYEGLITRKYQINRLTMNFEDYTDWVSEPTGRINPIVWGDYILALKATGEVEPIITVDNQEIEELRI